MSQQDKTDPRLGRDGGLPEPEAEKGPGVGSTSQQDLRAGSAPSLLQSRRFAVSVLVVAVGMAWMGTLSRAFYFYRSLTEDGTMPGGDAAKVEELPASLKEQRRAAETEIKKLRGKIKALLPRGTYVVVDTSSNRLYVKKGDGVLHEAVCSTGSNLLLRDPSGDRQWLFQTPRGMFHVRRKSRDPVWTKPDWAFIEEGKPLPERWSERRDEETLGDYALYFGDGYMIHGTLYQRYLGRSITHGCVRLGDEDLKRVFALTPLGAPIYIF